MNVLLMLAAMTLADAGDRQTIVVVVGAPGAEEFESQFNAWAERWKDAAETSGATLIRVGISEPGETDDRDRLREILAEQVKTSQEALWLVLIGHGTFDGRQAKFNVRGPDFTAKELAEWLKPCQRPLAVVNCASSSGPFVNRLSAPNRVIVTATKSGAEQNFARFGEFISAAIADPEADLDKDQQTSLLEAYLAASAGVAEFYEQQSRLATEHALLDDNGDGMATPAAWFRGVRATRTAKSGAQSDGQRANQFHLVRNQREARMPAEARQQRDDLELRIARLRDKKAELAEDAYYDQLRPLLLELARLYQGLEERPTDEPATKSK